MKLNILSDLCLQLKPTGSLTHWLDSYTGATLEDYIIRFWFNIQSETNGLVHIL